MTENLNGVLTALSTPFDQDEKIDFRILKRLVDRSIEAGVDGVVAGGSTGEFASLTPEERIELVDAIIEHTAGRVPVIAQTGATTTAEAIRFSQAAETSGADVLMVVTPYYEPLSLEETVTYIKKVAEAVSIPVMLYNIPDATGVNFDPATVRSLAEEVENIRYIKDSSADWHQALQLIHHHGDVIGTFIGWDTYIYGALVEGAAGVMAGAANVIPAEIVSVRRKIAAGDLQGAFEEWKPVYRAIDSMLSEPFISAVKAGLRLQSEPAGSPRAPMADVPAETQARIEKALSALRSDEN